MTTYIIRRLILLPLLVLGISLIVFVLVHLAPGDPISTQFGMRLSGMDQAQIDRMREDLGLNDPILVQYVRYMGRLLRGDMGESISTHTPVFKEIMDRFPATIELTLTAMIIQILISIPLGIISALKRGSLLDNALMGGALFGVSMPSFWLGIMLILLFSLTLGWLPTAGRGDGPLYERLNYLILPSLTLAVGMMAINSRMMRSSMLEVLGQDYVRTAHAKGLKKWYVLVKHALPNSLIPIVTLMGMQFAYLLGGAVVIETVFAWPGIGLIFSLIFIIMNLIVDILYTVIDPRIRYD